MVEYTIFQRHGTGKPFTLRTYKDIMSAKFELNEIISLEIERGRPFYVDNDFFENKYALGSNLYYLSILERDVTNWEKYVEEKENYNSNNIISFYNFKNL